MKKSLLIKLSISFVVVILSYCVFWFFKAGQSEKTFNRFLNEASAFISAQEIKVSGFPTKQKFLVKNAKVNLNSGIFRNHHISISEAEIEAGIFSNDFIIKISGPIKLEEADNSGRIFEVTFSSEPKIEAKIAGGIISNFSYSDNGFSISDEASNKIFATAATNLTISSSSDASGKIAINVKGAINKIESFDTADLFRNLFESKLVEALKNDEIKVNLPEGFKLADARAEFALRRHPIEGNPNAANSNQVNSKTDLQNAAIPALSQPSAPIANSKAINGDQNPKSASPSQNPSSPNNLAQQNPSSKNTAENNSAPSADLSKIVPSASPDASVAQQEGNIAEIKEENLNFDFTIELSGSDAQLQNAISGASEVDSGRVLKITEIKFQRGNYEISVNGSLTKTADDSLPSGGLSVKISGFPAMLDDLDQGMERLLNDANKYAEIVKPKADLGQLSANSGDLNANMVAQPAQPNPSDSAMQAKDVVANPSAPIATGDNATNAPTQQEPAAIYNMADYYGYFMIKFAGLYRPNAMDLAAKNTVSEQNVAQFDIRREKNLEFFVNETPVRELLGRIQ